ncbi:MAG: class I SAM-dependent methyltransferase [Defluviitaleaceae bacterium]|nr:class I SAM-dependent methyltransferase [Defluviitaleaceae bacterium]
MMTEKVQEMYVKNDTLTTRIDFNQKYRVNKYGFYNWVFDNYEFSEGVRILELGCGTAGSWLNRESRIPQGAGIVLSDFSPLMLEKAKNTLVGNSTFSFMQVDIQDIPFDDDEFDIVIANHMLYHVPDLQKALSEVNRVLKKGGCFYASTLGAGSHKELSYIYRKLEGKGSFSFTENITFTLDNGFDLLKTYFGKVEQRQFIDSFEVTSRDDLITYIKSYNDVPDDVHNELCALVNSGFVDGIFKISSEQGLFICHNI